MANHSKKFNDVRSYYKYHMWKKRQVVNAVKQGWSTEYKYEEITGESYPVQKEEEPWQPRRLLRRLRFLLRRRPRVAPKMQAREQM